METAVDKTRTRSGTGANAFKPFRKVAVLGAGTMGAQIAAHFANAGLEVELLDVAAKDGANPNAIVEKGLQSALNAKPDPFFSKKATKRIRAGNFDDHFDRLRDADWIVEAVVEKMDVKRQMAERIEQVASEDAIVSTNTSGLPIAEIVEGRSESFRARFLGTHFFNPPRYLRLLELIPTVDTDTDVLERVAWFGRVHLGKGIVVAKDRPYFIGNRIGVYGMMRAMSFFTDSRYTIEEIDTLTGPLVGRPKSATFRTADLVGLDVLTHVAQNLYEKIPEDESRDVFTVPEVLLKLVQTGTLGEKTGAGFYKKEGKEILSINPNTGAYEAPAPVQLEGLDDLQKLSLDERLRALYEDTGRAGQFFRETTLDLLGYTARRIPEISDDPADVDRAIRWGFGWEKGPFEIWDALGFERVVQDMKASGIQLPGWIDTMREAGHDRFYVEKDGENTVYVPTEERYVPDDRPSDEISLTAIRRHPDRTIWQNKEAALLDLGDGVALYEFRSKANTLGRDVMSGLVEAIERIENDPDLRGLVIGNEGKNFSVGANLGEVAMLAASGSYDQIERLVASFQQIIQRIRYAGKPVVVATHQRVLGGGCEMVMACPHPVAAAESYIGLVELGIGLIPAGTGTTRLAARAAELSPTAHPSHIQPYVQRFFENVAMARVSTSAVEAQELGYLAPGAVIVMNENRRFHAAKMEVIRLSEQGYLPPPAETGIRVLGRLTYAALEIGVRQLEEGRFISEFDRHLALQLAYVMTGGDLSAPQEVSEQYLLDLEREVFMRLLGDKRTQQRITHMLTTGKPLRN